MSRTAAPPTEAYNVFEHGSGRAVYYFEDGIFFGFLTGTPEYWLQDDWLHPFDGSKPTLYFGYAIGEPNPSNAPTDLAHWKEMWRQSSAGQPH